MTLGWRSYDVFIRRKKKFCTQIHCKMELFGYYCSDEAALLTSILTFIWLNFLWETYLKYRQVKLLISTTSSIGVVYYNVHWKHNYWPIKRLITEYLCTRNCGLYIWVVTIRNLNRLVKFCFWPTALCKVAPLSRHVVSLSVVVCCLWRFVLWLVWQADRRCLHPAGGFWGWPIQWNHAKCCGADPCCHVNDIWHKRGHPVAYRLFVCLSVTFYVLAKWHILAKNCLKEQIETTPRYQFIPPPFLP